MGKSSKKCCQRWIRRINSIDDDQEFRLCLRQALWAKKSLSRVRGYTPEQTVFGKMSRLPASIVGDDDASAHALADSECAEGIAFRRSLHRREQARCAFIKADNDNSYNRALLRRSRPMCSGFEAGDWVLYWEVQRSGTSRGKGRWYGPGRVICAEGTKVVWISHCGQLIRASPEQLRSASMREWQAIQNQGGDNRGVEGNIAGGTRHVVDLVHVGDLPSRSEVDREGDVPMPLPESANAPQVLEPEYSPSLTYSPSDPGVANTGEEARNSQPELEVSPANSESGEPEPDAGMEAPGLSYHEIPVPEDEDELLFGDTECFLAFPDQKQVWEMTLHETQVDPRDLPSAQQALEYVMLATPERKKRVEVRLKDLSEGEREQFLKAKDKEVGAWISHQTVRKVAAGTLADEQLLRCRWILTWKAPEQPGGVRRAKARLVVLGFEDPNISEIPSDAPTLGKDAGQLILQKVASNGWKLVNFDISTAFLQGQGDGRVLGIHPPDEIRQALRMKSSDQCQLMGGAYGRIDAPFLWFQTLKGTLEELGFVQSPFDACTFLLITPDSQGHPRVHGVLGIHVDDGLGGGDSYFSMVIQKLREKYSFGSYDEGEFTFTGIHFRQWDDGSIEYDQQEYLERIQPAHIPKHRRSEPEAHLSEAEVHELRRLNGSIQYAAVHTRPDLSAKVGMLQSIIPKAQIRHLIEANRLLHEAKANPVSLMIVPIQEDHVTFCTFSDASFATSKDSNSYGGTLVVATDWRMLANEKAVIVPMAWSSRKIARVVRSTLSAEVVSLCNSVDRMSWLRLFWEWIKDPSIDISQPDRVLQEAPRAVLVTDCKSAFDIATKTAVPSCTELRTQLECLLLRERLQENCQMRWVHSKAMLADCLTKTMDSSELRRCLASGQYALFDEGRVLADRLGKRQSLKWLQTGSKSSASEQLKSS